MDTSVWIDHLHKGVPALQRVLDNGQVIAHPFVIGELALGNMRQRDVILEALGNLGQAVVAKEPEVLHFIDKQMLSGCGIGYMDAHLLAAVALTPGTLLWTRDQRLRAAAERLSFHADLK